MNKLIATFLIEQQKLNGRWEIAGTKTFNVETNKLPIKFSELKKFAEKNLSEYLRVSELQSICDVTDLVEFDEE